MSADRMGGPAGSSESRSSEALRPLVRRSGYRKPRVASAPPGLVRSILLCHLPSAATWPVARLIRVRVPRPCGTCDRPDDPMHRPNVEIAEFQCEIPRLARNDKYYCPSEVVIPRPSFGRGIWLCWGSWTTARFLALLRLTDGNWDSRPDPSLRSG